MLRNTKSVIKEFLKYPKNLLLRGSYRYLENSKIAIIHEKLKSSYFAVHYNPVTPPLQFKITQKKPLSTSKQYNVNTIKTLGGFLE